MIEPVILRALIHHLRICLVETQAAKDQRRPPPEIRTGHLGRLGPSDPHLNPTAFSDYEQIRRELYHWCVTWRDVACPTAKPVDKEWSGQRCCDWLVENAVMIAASPDAELFAQDLERYGHMLSKYLPPAPEIQEQWQTAHSICYRMRKLGHHISPELLRKWAERGFIATKRIGDSKNRYLFSEVLDRYANNMAEICQSVSKR